MPSKDKIWGEIPPGFTKITDHRGNQLVVRQERASHIDFSICADDGNHAQLSGYEGRAPIRARTLPDGETALIRSYRHGGLLRALTGEWFFTWPPRPFRELAITEELRRRNVRTVEVLAACVSHGAGPFYRGWLVTRQLAGAEDLWSALQSGFVSRVGLEVAMRAVAESVRAIHREGIYHDDLNLKNILLRLENGGVVSYIIDFDKAKLYLGRLPAEIGWRNLKRLRRSALKLDPEQKYLPSAAWRQLVEFYHASSDA
jgi:3-deoxy-D-manno-octulosonic acid kinase